MKSEKQEKQDEFFVGKQEKHIDILRKNVDSLMEKHDYTIKELAEKADISFDSLKTFLYDKSAKDCKLSTAIKLAKVFNVTIVELADTGTIDEQTLHLMKIYRELPASSKAFVDWIVDYQKFTHEQHSNKKIINIMNPICVSNGNLKKSNDYDPLDISEIGSELLHKVFMGIRIPCEHYLPHYLKGDILLIANDRDAIQGENTVIIINGNLMITRRVIENNQVKYYGLRDGIFHSGDADNIYVLGYIAHVIESNE